MIKKIFVLFSLITSYLFIALPAFAQTSLVGHRCLYKGTSVVTLDCIPIIVGNIIFWLLVFAGIVALILIIISGFKFVTSGGEPKKAEGARKTLTYAVIGLFVILISFGIVAFIAQQTGVGCIRRFGFTQCVPEDIAYSCSREHPDGYCPDAEQLCVNNDAGSHRVCRFPCSSSHPAGWCAQGKDCRPAGGGIYRCR